MLRGYYANVREANETYAFGLDNLELDVLDCGEGMYVVIDSDETRLFRTRAKSSEEAITKYIDECYGQVRVWKLFVEDGVADGYEESDEFAEASTFYIIGPNHAHFDMWEGW